MSHFAIIGGSGLTQLKDLKITGEQTFNTPYGSPSDALVFGELSNQKVVFLPRHGSSHSIPPHKVNYRANLWALKEAGASKVIAVAAVGGISSEMHPERLVIPDQIIDYTYGRSQTYFEDNLDFVTHIDFTQPYDENLRQQILAGCEKLNVDAANHAVYAATQGPRLESAAEINRLKADGCDIVGMTGMPEAALARELKLDYACCALVVNWAAGRGGHSVISVPEMEKYLKSGMVRVGLLLQSVLSSVAN